jgi:beta-lactamase regulating signal transducer with metallopeptidase domain
MLWTEKKRHVALIHELAHVRRKDPLTMLLTSFTACLFWFNPWIY